MAIGVMSAAFSLLAFLVCLVIYIKVKWRNYPPGPVGFPFVGSLLLLGKKPHVTLRDLGRKYGDIFSYSIGPQLIVCLTDYHSAKEILSHPLAMSRPPYAFDFLTGNGGFAGMNDEKWLEQRRFALHTMKDLGLGKGIWERMIQDSVNRFIEEVKLWKGIATYVDKPLSFSIANNMISLLIGRKLDQKDDEEDIQIIQKSTRELMKNLSSVSVIVNVPGVKKAMELLNLGGYNSFISLVRKFENIFRREVMKRITTAEHEAYDFIDYYLKEMEDKANDQNSSYTMDNLVGNMFGLFLAGNDSTFSSVSWLLLVTAAYEDVQKKIHEEIDSTLGRDGPVYYDDRMNLPYTVATIMETERWVAINPLYPPRYASKSFKFRGYTIPAGCYIVCNIWAVMHDARYFEDPMKFKPERFLTENGTKVLKPDGYAPFSFGRRNCPGEAVAMMTIYLYFVAIMQKFKVTPSPGKQVDMDCPFGLGLLPKPQDLCFIER